LEKNDINKNIIKDTAYQTETDGFTRHDQWISAVEHFAQRWKDIYDEKVQKHINDAKATNEGRVVMRLHLNEMKLKEPANSVKLTSNDGILTYFQTKMTKTVRCHVVQDLLNLCDNTLKQLVGLYLNKIQNSADTQGKIRMNDTYFNAIVDKIRNECDVTNISLVQTIIEEQTTKENFTPEAQRIEKYKEWAKKGKKIFDAAKDGKWKDLAKEILLPQSWKDKVGEFKKDLVKGFEDWFLRQHSPMRNIGWINTQIATLKILEEVVQKEISNKLTNNLIDVMIRNFEVFNIELTSFIQDQYTKKHSVFIACRQTMHTENFDLNVKIIEELQLGHKRMLLLEKFVVQIAGKVGGATTATIPDLKFFSEPADSDVTKYQDMVSKILSSHGGLR